MILTILLTLFCTVYCTNDVSTEEPFKVYFNNNTTRNRFAGLLKSVIKLNEGRLRVLQKWYTVQSGMPTESLRSKHFWQRYVTKLRPRVFVIIVIPNSKNPSNHDLPPFNSNGQPNKQTDDISPKYYRRKWQKSRSKKAIKVCTSACRDAFKKLCRRFKCTHAAKKAIKKQCKFTCQRDFSSGKYSDSSDTSSSDSSDSDCE